ncbi:hypothetical protein [Pseudomonas sp. KB-10]|uniref:hypothetical protein n=1 Tax=Pseudomonas sp. KB-10 TaxID=2292264 RepID=UPI001BAF677A|nr:hypothetical protein [Pseudomonas sp. KB-10]
MTALQNAALATLVLSLSACSLLPAKTDSEQVEARSQERLDQLMAGNIEKAYAFSTPGYRETHSQARFRADYAAGISRYVSASVKSASCEQDACTVMVDVRYKYVSSIGSKPMVIERATQERWIRTEGQWWFLRQN